MPLIVTEEMRSMIASHLLAGAVCEPECRDCLCCSPHCLDLCEIIVGDWKHELWDWFYNECGCNWANPDRQTGDFMPGVSFEQHYLDKISNLRVLYTAIEINNGEDQIDPDALVSNNWPPVIDVENQPAVPPDFLVQFVEREG